MKQLQRSGRQHLTSGRLLPVLHVLAWGLALAGVLAHLIRPLAPDLGPLPDPLRWFDAADLERARAYRAPLLVTGLLGLLIRLVVPLLIALTPPGRRLVDVVVARVGHQRPARAAAAVVLVVVIALDVALLPVNLWFGYVREVELGLRTGGVALYLRDWAAATVPVWIGVGVLVLGGYTLARRLPRAWPALAGILGGALAGVVVLAAPLLLEPLTLRTEPLADGPVRTEVEHLVERSGERIDRLLVADASRRTTRQNAYVSGLAGTRRIVLYDTLVTQRPAAEVAVVVAHELGHQRNLDLPRGVLGGFTGATVIAYAIALLVRWRTRAGRQTHPADPRGAGAVLALVVLLLVASAPIQGWVSRRAEAAADLAALDLTGDPGTFTAMKIGLARANLTDPRPPRWATWVWGTHPPTAARLEMAERWPDLDAPAATAPERRP